MSDWLTWQIVDSAFPTGTFAHSWGLEAAWQQGDVDDLPALRAFLEATIRQTARGVIPLVNAAYHAPERLLHLDALADAFLINAVANSASRVQGRTLLATVGRIWPNDRIAALQARCAAGHDTGRQAGGGAAAAGHEGNALHYHVAPITGAALRIVGLPLDTVQRAVLFAAARGVTSAAVRLGIAGSYEAQRLLFECGPLLDDVASRCRVWDEEDLAQTEPIIDLLQSAHARLYSRLFQS
jgi:urease accessory protein